MPFTKKKYKLNVLLTVILLLFLALVFLQAARRAAGRIAGDFFYPFLAYPVKAQHQLANKALLLESKAALAAAVENTEKLNLQLSAELSAFSSLQAENIELRQLLELKKRISFNFVFAEILLRDPAVWDQRFTVDKGSDDGVTQGSVVVTGVMLDNKLVLAAVGRVGKTSRHSAEVISLASPENKLSIKIPDVAASGILEQGFRKGNRLLAKAVFLPRDLNYAPGMKVYTSGMSRLTPAGIYVGQLSGDTSSIKVKNNLYSEADVELGVDFNAMRFVMIIAGGK